MKYIRTKDGIYKSKRKPIEKDCLVLGVKPNGKIGVVRKDIIKIADTIEELFDEIVAIDNNDKPRILDCFDIKERKEVYGAIWIKGEHEEPILKSVAQLNEKGWKLL